MTRKSLVKKFDKQAGKYDKRRNSDKTYKFRKKIFPEAEGKVLEVAIGSGFNFPFYDSDVELTGIDFSHEMLKTAERASKNYPFQTTLLQRDVETVGFEENSFDTIVSSLSFCAYQNPVNVLDRFQKWCKPEGKILMMEHGISTNRLLAGAQKVLDPVAVKAVGCHQNRNILDIVKRSDLKIIREERYLAGCLYLVWAKPY